MLACNNDPKEYYGTVVAKDTTDDISPKVLFTVETPDTTKYYFVVQLQFANLLNVGDVKNFTVNTKLGSSYDKTYFIHGKKYSKHMTVYELEEFTDPVKSTK